MESSTKFTIRPTRKSDLPELLALAVEEGWNDSLEYLQLCLLNNPSGYFMAENQDGRLISHCGANVIDDKNGALCLFVTRKEMRGRGIGKQVMANAVESLAGRNILLNASWDAIEMYKSSGYHISSFALHIYYCPMEKVSFDEKLINLPQSSQLENLKDIKIDKILNYDDKIHPIERALGVEASIKAADFGNAVVKDGKVIGWGCLTRRELGYALMPVYADDVELAKVIIYSLLKHIPKTSSVEVAFPAVNADAQSIYDEVGISRGVTDHNMRMYNLRDVQLPLHRLYSIMNYHTVLC